MTKDDNVFQFVYGNGKTKDDDFRTAVLKSLEKIKDG